MPKASSSNWFICFGVIGGLKSKEDSGRFINLLCENDPPLLPVRHVCWKSARMSACAEFPKKQPKQIWCLPKNPDCQNIFLGFVINCQTWFWTVIFLLLLKVFPLSNRKPTCVSVSSQVILCGKFQVATVHRTMSRSLWIESRLFRTSV